MTAQGFHGATYRRRGTLAAAAVRGLVAGTAMVIAGSVSGQQAAAYPDRPIKMVVAFGAGGPADTMARLIASKMEENLKVPVIVENKGGAGGLIAAAEAARAKADGHTVLYTAGSAYTISPSMLPKMQIDMHKLFTPVSYGHRQNMLMAVNAELPVKNLQEFVAYAKSHPMNYASPGPGTLPHLMAEMLKKKLGFEATHIAYKSGADMQRASLAGEVQFIVDATSSAMGNIRSGRLRPLAMADTKRIALLPDVPTFAEAGVQDMVIYSWGALLVPAGTPEPIVARLNSAMAAAQKDPDLVARMRTFNAEPYTSTPQQVHQEAEREMALWAQLIRELKIAER